MSAPPLDDVDLIHAWQRGEQDAADEIGRRYDRYVLSMALDRRKSRPTLNADDLWWAEYQDARDLAQDSWRKVCERIGTFRGDSRFGTWLYRIVKNAAIDRTRREARRRREAQISLRPGQPAAQRFDREEFYLPEAAYLHLPNPETVLLANERVVTLRLAVHGLPPEQKAAFIAFYWTKLEEPEIAKVFQVPRRTVIDRLERARETLRAKLPPSYRRTRPPTRPRRRFNTITFKRPCDFDEVATSNLMEGNACRIEKGKRAG